jgi:hypothetical protein
MPFTEPPQQPAMNKVGYAAELTSSVFIASSPIAFRPASEGRHRASQRPPQRLTTAQRPPKTKWKPTAPNNAAAPSNTSICRSPDETQRRLIAQAQAELVAKWRSEEKTGPATVALSDTTRGGNSTTGVSDGPILQREDCGHGLCCSPFLCCIRCITAGAALLRQMQRATLSPC